MNAISDVEITCTPGNGMQRVDPDVIAALDLLGITLARTTPPNWRVGIYLPDVLITARPHTTNQPQEATA